MPEEKLKAVYCVVAVILFAAILFGVGGNKNE